VDGQGEEVLARLCGLCRHDGGEHDGFARGGEHGAIRLAGNLAGLESQGLAAPVELDLVVIKFDRHLKRLPILPDARERKVRRALRTLRCARTGQRTPCAYRLKIRHCFLSGTDRTWTRQ